jgi:hypothetical protein
MLLENPIIKTSCTDDRTILPLCTVSFKHSNNSRKQTFISSRRTDGDHWLATAPCPFSLLSCIPRRCWPCCTVTLPPPLAAPRRKSNMLSVDTDSVYGNTVGNRWLYGGFKLSLRSFIRVERRAGQATAHDALNAELRHGDWLLYRKWSVVNDGLINGSNSDGPYIHGAFTVQTEPVFLSTRLALSRPRNISQEPVNVFHYNRSL